MPSQAQARTAPTMIPHGCAWWLLTARDPSARLLVRFEFPWFRVRSVLTADRKVRGNLNFYLPASLAEDFESASRDILGPSRVGDRPQINRNKCMHVLGLTSPVGVGPACCEHLSQDS